MKWSSSNLARRGFTILETVVLVVVAFILFVVFAMPNFDRGGRPRMVACLNNQRQIVLAEFLWNTDNRDQWLWQVQPIKPPVLDFPTAHFQALTPYLHNATAFVCPTDPARTPADGITALTRSNLSYFINCSASPARTNSILAGDRHLAIDNLPVGPGTVTFSTQRAITWTREMHASSKLALGALGFTDGHAAAAKAESLGAVFRNQKNATNLLVIP